MTCTCFDTIRLVLQNSITAVAVKHVEAAGLDWAEDLEEDARDEARDHAREMLNIIAHRMGVPLL